jgi:hypothetical protein
MSNIVSAINRLFPSSFKSKSVVYSHPLCLLQAPTERRGNTPALHYKGLGFKSRPGDIPIIVYYHTCNIISTTVFCCQSLDNVIVKYLRMPTGALRKLLLLILFVLLLLKS